MSKLFSAIEDLETVPHDVEDALSTLRHLPDGCAKTVADLATRLGTEKLTLIQWARSDGELARLVASKLLS